MRLKVASRKSDLARWQAVQVGRALEQLPEKPNIEFIFKSSLGDQNLDLPLASMGSKGVFTEDFYNDLVGGLCDLVVHSWKDLPVDERDDTHIAMTLPRADMRDVLLVPESVWQAAADSGRLRVLTSSPRRVYNLATALPQLLPAAVEIEFVPVRGNVPTRLQKMYDEGAALVLAKAGLDRLLQAEHEGFVPGSPLKALVEGCLFQILPVSLNPPAPAQGALAVEVARSNETITALCSRLMDESTFACVQKEREVLKSYGGGCHQKIGVAVIPREYGLIRALRGLTEQGEVLNEWRIENGEPWSRAAAAEKIFPLEAAQNSWFERRPLPLSEDLSAKPGLFIARADALPLGFKPSLKQKVWTAGVQTWAKLAKQGIWVNGCQDGLGESEDFALEHLAGPIEFVKLTHSQAAVGSDAVATYQLHPKKETPDLRGKTHFFWMSRTSFERAFELFPQEIINGHNACGPGVTYEFLKRHTQLKRPVKVFAGLEQFLRETRP